MRAQHRWSCVRPTRRPRATRRAGDRIAGLKRRISTMIGQAPDYQLLRSVPGIGPERTLFRGFPLRVSISACRTFASGSRWGLPSSRRFSSSMPGARDPDRPSGISPCRYRRSMFVFSVLCLVSRQCHKISTLVRTDDSSVLASGSVTPSPPAFLSLTRLHRFRVVRYPLYVLSCVLCLILVVVLTVKIWAVDNLWICCGNSVSIRCLIRSLRA